MKLLERVEAVGARRRLAKATVGCYRDWIVKFLRFCRDGSRWRRPAELGTADVERFLTHLAVRRRVSASAQNQAMCALVFLYKQVLGEELGSGYLGKFQAERARRPGRVPTVLSVDEVRRLIEAMTPGSAARTMAALMYGTGLRVMECCTLRVRDVDFDRRQIVVRGGKGDKDRVVMLPAALAGPLADQIRRVRHRHALDVERGGGVVPLPVTRRAADAGGGPIRARWTAKSDRPPEWRISLSG
jgi:site-specific recombinase XerD